MNRSSEWLLYVTFPWKLPIHAATWHNSRPQGVPHFVAVLHIDRHVWPQLLEPKRGLLADVVVRSQVVHRHLGPGRKMTGAFHVGNGEMGWLLGWLFIVLDYSYYSYYSYSSYGVTSPLGHHGNWVSVASRISPMRAWDWCPILDMLFPSASNICWKLHTPIVGWCETKGHLPTPGEWEDS